MDFDVTVDVHIDEDDRHTLVFAKLDLRGDHFEALGRAKRNPVDRPMPVVGEELATARPSATSHSRSWRQPSERSRRSWKHDPDPLSRLEGMHLEVISRIPEGNTRPQAIVFVHGAWHGAWCWSAYLDWFSQRGWECLAVDLRGHGLSENRRSLRWTSIKDYVEDLGHVVDGLDRPPLVVGHSMGGLVVQRYLEERTLPGCILLAPDPVGGVWRATLRVARRHPLHFLKANATLSLWPLISTPERAWEMFFADDIPAEEALAAWESMQDESFRAYLEMIFRRPRPDRVDTPVKVIGGGADRIFSVREMARTAAAYGGEALIVDGAAHDLMLDPRREEVAITMEEWLEGIAA